MKGERARPPLSALIFSPLPFVGGGVLEFTEMLVRHLSTNVAPERFWIGQRQGRLGKLLRILVPVYDALRLALRLSTQRHHIYHLNPSLDPKSVLRDGLFLALLCMLRRKHVLVFVHGWNVEYYRRVAARPISRRLFRTVYGRASRILVLASAFADDLAALGIPRDKIHVVTTMFEGNALQRVIRSRDDEQIRILFLARLVAEKGIFELLEAFRHLRSEDPRLMLTMAGDGPDARRAREWCRQHGLQDEVQFPGYVTGADKAQLLVDSDIFVLPSAHGEGCPVALLEAMGAGLPVIVTPVGGVADIVRDGVNGFLIRPHDSAAVETALGALATDAQLRGEMGRRNHEQAWQRYEAGKIAAALERHYGEIARGESSPRVSSSG